MKDIIEINMSVLEGRLLLAALAKITTESQKDKTPNEVLEQVTELSEKMFEDKPFPQSTVLVKPNGFFEDSLKVLINRHSIENDSNTPDFILAKFIMGCLDSFEKAIQKRDNWFGGKQSILDSERGSKWVVE